LRVSKVSKNVKWINISKYEPRQYFINKGDFNSRIIYQNPLKKISRLLCQVGVEVESLCDTKKNTVITASDFNTIDELREYRIADISLGAIVYSAIVSVKHSTAISFDNDADLINHFLNSATEMLYQLEAVILRTSPNLIVTVNDRLPGSAITVALARKWRIEVSVVYWGSNPNRIIDYSNSLYDSRQWQIRIKDNWNFNKPSEIEQQELRKQITDLIVSPSSDSQTFLHGQSKGKGISKSNYIVVFYAQSEHEHSSTYLEGIEGRFMNQYEAFKSLEKVCDKLQFDLVLKLHPNRFDSTLTIDSELEQKEWIDKISTKTLVIEKNSDVDTYQLLNDADLNVVWNSTVGIESIARSKPTLALGNAHWLNMDWNIHAWNEPQLLRRIQNESYAIGPEELIPWFWYLKDYGVSCQFTSLGSELKVSGEVIIKKRSVFRIFSFLKARIESFFGGTQ